MREESLYEEVISLVIVISILLTFTTMDFAASTSMLSTYESGTSDVILSIPYSSNIIGTTGMDGNVYQMITSYDNLNIVKLGYLADYTKRPAYIDTIKNDSVCTSKIDATKGMETVSTPYIAFSRARDIVWYEWSFNPATHGNKTLNDIPNNVVQPQYLQGLQNITSQIGIPYSWGGSRGLDVEYQSGYNTTFPQAVAAGKYTGNAGGDISTGATCGLDCSGFVDVVFQTGSKHNTAGLAGPEGSGKPFRYVSGDPEHMDIYNSPGDHVFVFWMSGYPGGGNLYYYILESTTTYNYRGGAGAHDDKTVAAGFYVDEADIEDYSLARLDSWCY